MKLIIISTTKKKEAEHHFKMVELAERLDGDTTKLFKSKRIFQMESECIWSEKYNDKKKARGTLYIFNDSILYTKAIKKKQKVVSIIPMDSIKGLLDKSPTFKVIIRYDDAFFRSAHILEFKFPSVYKSVLVAETLKRYILKEK